MDERAKINNIIQMYSGLTYVQVYGNQIAWVLFFTIAEILFIVYFYLKKNTKAFQEKWTDVRCDWNVMPFAGFINKPEDKTIVEYTQENYNYCTSQSLEKSMNNHFESTFKTQQQINDMISGSNDLAAKNIAVSNTSNTDVNDNINDATSTVYQIFNLLHVGFIIFTDTLTKLTDVLKTTANFGMTGITWATLFFKMMISAVMTLLIILFVATVIPAMPIFWLIFPLVYAILFAFLLTVSSSFEHTVFMIADEFSKVEPFTPMKTQPKLNLCFGENTRIQTTNGYKKIKNVKVGDVLKNGSRVTATFKTVVTPVFNLKGIIVSGEHYVKYGGWIKVKEHPESVPGEYKGKYLYCLNATSKTITIRGNEFLDWDDLIPEKMEHALKFYKTRKNIHLYDTGFSSLKLKTNRGYNDISKIEPDDIIGNARVIATVCLKDKYHLVTDTGDFNGFKDYNYNIDKLFYLNELYEN
jgi:hypothetical protein